MTKLRTKNIITQFNEVDEEWCFQFYLGLTEKLEGQPVEMLTPFKEERTPSFFLFCEKRYFFKCYSTNNGGDIYDLVRLMFKYPNKAIAVSRVFWDYENYLNASGQEYKLNDYSGTTYREHKRFHVESYEMRGWNNIDAQFWGKYFVGSSLLEQYFISPLKLVQLAKTENGVESRAKLERPLLYGYFRKTGDLYKIYQPGNSIKYIKVADYIQGTEQLSLNRPNLLITKSLKDIVGFRGLGIEEWDVIAPESENALIPADYMEVYKKRYKNIKTLFDNDEAGERAKLLYKEVYGLGFLDFNLGQKDLTDSLEVNGKEKVKQLLITLLLK